MAGTKLQSVIEIRLDERLELLWICVQRAGVPVGAKLLTTDKRLRGGFWAFVYFLLVVVIKNRSGQLTGTVPVIDGGTNTPASSLRDMLVQKKNSRTGWLYDLLGDELMELMVRNEVIKAGKLKLTNDPTAGSKPTVFWSCSKFAPEIIRVTVASPDGRQGTFGAASFEQIKKAAIRIVESQQNEKRGVAERGVQTWEHYRIPTVIRDALEAPVAGFEDEFIHLLENALTNFSGRDWVWPLLDGFIESQYAYNDSRGYFHIMAPPGWGKTALSAKAVRERSYYHYFFQRSSRYRSFAEILRSQMQIRLKCQLEPIPEDRTEERAYVSRLFRLLSEESKREGVPVVIVVDALDEDPNYRSGLPFPLELSQGIFVLTTERVDGDTTHSALHDLEIRKVCPWLPVDLTSVAAEQRVDVDAYLGSSVNAERIALFARETGEEPDNIAKQLADRSEGNFMYLKYVIADLLDISGKANFTGLSEIPKTLEQYYELHLSRMQSQGAADGCNEQMRLMLALMFATRVLPTAQIATIAELGMLRAQELLREKSAFLLMEPISGEMFDRSGLVKAFRFYHSHFQEWLRTRAELPDTVECRSRIEKNWLHFMSC